MNQVSAYLRVSTGIQADANGVDAQRHAIDRWLAYQGLTIAPERFYVELGLSGAKDKRPAFQALMAAVRAGEVSTIVTASLSRLGRRARKLLELVEELQKRGVRLVMLQENWDLSTASGRLMLTIAAGFAEYERELVGDRTKAGFAARRAKGLPVGGACRFNDGKRGCTKLTKEQWEGLYLRKQGGESVVSLARELGLSHSATCRKLKAIGRARPQPVVA